MKSAKREAFSLIEMIIAIAIVGFVMAGVILLISYGTNSMRKTNNQLTLQNQAKDLLMHMTTHLQEASDAKFYDDGTTQVIIAAKGKDFVNSEATSVDIDLYWTGKYVDPSSSVEEKVIYYYNWNYPEGGWNPTTGTLADYKDAKGDINYDKLIDMIKDPWFDGYNNDAGDIFEGNDKRTCILCKNVKAFKQGVIPDAVSGGGAYPVLASPASGSAATIGKSMTFSVLLENYNGDTQFKTTKTVYFRNQ